MPFKKRKPLKPAGKSHTVANSKKTPAQKKEQDAAVPKGPGPLLVFLIIISSMLLLSILFAALKVFVIGDALLGSEIVAQENGSINITFCQQTPCEDIMLKELSHADTISCAFYDLDLQKTTKMLAEKNANVTIYEQKSLLQAKTFGLEATQAYSDGLMHHKFCVLDINTQDARVITGSMNPTENDAKRNDNNLLVIHSNILANRYQAEYDEIASRTSKAYKKNPAHALFLNLSGIMIEQRFCPQESCEAAALQQIGGAQHTIEFMTFSFTSDPIGTALIESSKKGINIRGIFEKRQNDQWSEYPALQRLGIDVHTDGNQYTMHHKVFIIDGTTVITGSYNPTKNGNERNDENMLIITNKGIAAQYEQEFERVYSIATLAK
jgi:hypothetical protein